MPQLSAAQFARLTAYAVPELVAAGDVVFSPGDIDYDLIVIESGRIEIVSPASRDDPEAVVAVYEGGGFLGELNFFTGQTAYLIGRVAESGSYSPDLSRAVPPRAGRGSRSVRHPGPHVPGPPRSVARRPGGSWYRDRGQWRIQREPRSTHICRPPALAASVAGRRQRGRPCTIHSSHLLASDLPAVFTPHDVLRVAAPGEMAQLLGLAYRRKTDDLVDLTVIGCGPAGLGAAQLTKLRKAWIPSCLMRSRSAGRPPPVPAS